MNVIKKSPSFSPVKKTSDSPENTTEISAIPPEILLEVFSFLNDGKSLNAITSVNHTWGEVSITAIKKKAFSVLKDFAIFLADNLKEYKIYEKDALYDVESDRKILGSVNLLEVKSSCDELKNRILFILKGLNEKDLKELEVIANEKIPNFFNVFKLIEEGRQKHKNRLKEIHAESDLEIQETNLKELIVQLMEENDIDMTLEAIKILPSDSKRSSFCKAIAMEFFEKSIALKQEEQKLDKSKKEFESLIDLAFSAANFIPQIHEKQSVFKKFFKELAGLDCLDQIKAKLDDSLLFFGAFYQSHVLNALIKELINENNLIHVVKLAEMFPPCFNRDADLMKVYTHLEKKKESVLAKEVANLMSDHQKKEFLELSASIVKEQLNQ